MGSAELGDRVHGVKGHANAPLSGGGVHDEVLPRPVIHDRRHGLAPEGERTADLDLRVTALEATAELEDPPPSRGAARELVGALLQREVGALRDLALRRLEPTDEESCHFRDARAGFGGNRRRSSAVILRIVSEPSLTCLRICSSFARRCSAARSAWVGILPE